MDSPRPHDSKPPPLGHFLREAGSFAAMKMRRLSRPRGGAAQVGEGRPVMVLPGFLASDTSSLLLRRTLEASGYRACGWGLGLNMGVRNDLFDRLDRQLDRAARRGPVSLIGWSLGGVYARELAKRQPGKVARVITMGSPFSGDIRANHGWRLYEILNGHKVDSQPMAATVGEKPPVPTIAFWSREDGIVAPASARGKPHECDSSIELNCTHMGFMSDADALRAVLAALAD